MNRVALLTLLVMLGGCRYAYEEHGDARFIDVDLQGFEVGKTTPREAALKLGPPSATFTDQDRLWFVWRYEQVRDRSVTLRYFGGRWVQGRYGNRIDSTLMMVFDEEDRLALATRSIETR